MRWHSFPRSSSRCSDLGGAVSGEGQGTHCQREQNVQVSQQDLDKLIKQIPFFKVAAWLL